MPIPSTAFNSSTLACSIPLLPPKCLSRDCIFLAPKPSISSKGSLIELFRLLLLWYWLTNRCASSLECIRTLPRLSRIMGASPSIKRVSSLFARAANINFPDRSFSTSDLLIVERWVSPPSRRSKSGHSFCFLAHLITDSSIILRSSAQSPLIL